MKKLMKKKLVKTKHPVLMTDWDSYDMGYKILLGFAYTVVAVLIGLLLYIIIAGIYQALNYNESYIYVDLEGNTGEAYQCTMVKGELTCTINLPDDGSFFGSHTKRIKVTEYTRIIEHK